jgi:hypothetical protein
METTQKRRRGRPAMGEGKGRQAEFIGVRVPRQLKEKIEQQAEIHGHSVSRECQTRIEGAYAHSETLTDATRMAHRLAYGEKGAVLMQLFGRILRHAPINGGMDIDDDWLADPTAFSVFERELDRMVDRLRPAGTSKAIAGEQPEHRIERVMVGMKLIEAPAEWAEEDAQ